MRRGDAHAVAGAQLLHHRPQYDEFAQQGDRHAVGINETARCPRAAHRARK
jgi:hypothetical protein